MGHTMETFSPSGHAAIARSRRTRSQSGQRCSASLRPKTSRADLQLYRCRYRRRRYGLQERPGRVPPPSIRPSRSPSRRAPRADRPRRITVRESRFRYRQAGHRSRADVRGIRTVHADQQHRLDGGAVSERDHMPTTFDILHRRNLAAPLYDA